MPKKSKFAKSNVASVQRDIVFFRERAEERAANAAKSERLRALRLEKEAQDRAAAEIALRAKGAKRKR